MIIILILVSVDYHPLLSMCGIWKYTPIENLLVTKIANKNFNYLEDSSKWQSRQSKTTEGLENVSDNKKTILIFSISLKSEVNSWGKKKRFKDCHKLRWKRKCVFFISNVQEWMRWRPLPQLNFSPLCVCVCVGGGGIYQRGSCIKKQKKV